GYDSTFVMGPGFHSGKFGGANLPEEMKWLWRGFWPEGKWRGGGAGRGGQTPGVGAPRAGGGGVRPRPLPAAGPPPPGGGRGAVSPFPVAARPARGAGDPSSG